MMMTRSGAALLAWAMLIGTQQALPADSNHTPGMDYDHHWPFQQQPRNVWSKAMSPQSGTAMFVINNRPVVYKTDRAAESWTPLEAYSGGDILQIADLRTVAGNYRLAELFLLKALRVASEHDVEEPWDVVQSQVNLGTFYYQRGRYDESLTMFSSAVGRAETVRGSDSLELAEIQDHLAMVCRALRKFDRAEELYENSLRIRQIALGPAHSAVAASYMNLAMLYSDAGRADDAKMLQKAHEIMGESAYISSRLTPSARPVSTNMPGRVDYQSELPEMVAAANEIILKHPPVPAVPARPAAALAAAPPGIAEIVGTWSVATDDWLTTQTRTRSYAEHTLSGEETVTESKHEDGLSQFQNVRIYLVDARHANRILGQISRYGQCHGLNRLDYGRTWPTTRRQALEIVGMMDAAAQSSRVNEGTTDKNGEYHIGDIPKGSYALYASLATQSQVLVWIRRPISVSQRTVLTFDFNSENVSSTLWKTSTAGKQISQR